MKKLIISLMLIPNLVFAVCDKPVSYLTEGKPALCNGFLFTPEEEEKVRFKVIKYDEIVDLVKKQDEMINLLSNRLDVSQQRLIFTEQNLKETEKRTQTELIVYFCLGIVLGISTAKIIK